MENAANWRTESRTVYSSDFKLRMVELASRPDANVAQLARWICPYISRHLLSLNPLLARCRRYSRGER